jgi:hypothetical protein
MKRFFAIVLATAVMIVGIGIGAASAANSLKQGSAGINVNVFDSLVVAGEDVDNSFVITGKYFVMNDLAVLAGLGFGVKGGDADGTDFGIVGGARKYLTTDDFAPFVGGFLAYASTEDGDRKDLSLLGEFGAEYFLHKQFSIEGSVGFGYMEQKTTTPGPGGGTFKETTIGTQRLGASLNFYFF